MNKTSSEIKTIVREKYAEISAQSATENATSCCGVGGCATVDYTIFADDYSQLKGYNPDADLGLGCGLPTEFAQIKPGDTVVDLGSGAGNDCFVAREIAGNSGRVIGIDMTPQMIEKARANTDKLGFNNVEFRLGDIEEIPIGGGVADVVVSNCVLNLVPNKEKAFAEMFRILKSGGHFSVSDVVIKGNLPDSLKNDAEMYAGCVSGAIEQQEYLDLLFKVGFDDITIQKSKEITLPDDILRSYFSEEELHDFRASQTGIYSITVYGKKPETCYEGSGCC